MKISMSIEKKLALVLLPAALLAAPLALDERLHLRGYAVRSPKVYTWVRLALLADFHNDKSYGSGQQVLVDAVRRAGPDVVLMVGDMAERRCDNHNTFELVRALAGQYPCYYASGNHEQRNLPHIKTILRHMGVHVLAGDCRTITLKGQRLQICGIDDPASGRQEHLRQEARAARGSDAAEYRILVAHRPEYIDYYAHSGYDLIVCGHAHGGQWRLPPLVDGLFSPDQGLLPKYAGGQYHVRTSTAIVSRGLARTNTLVPRIFNPPELVVIDLLPERVK